MYKIPFNRDERGSFTIESAIVFPVIFFVTIIFIFLSLYVYQKVQLYYLANQVAERAAFVWNNSHKDPITGEINGPSGVITPDNTKEFLSNKHRDGLYWRAGEIINILFNRSDSPAKSELAFQSGNQPSSEGGSTIGTKLSRMIKSGMIPEGVSGTITYSNYVVKRSIEVELSNPLKLPSMLERYFGDTVKAQASSTITEPVEFIRNIELVRFYGNKIVKKHSKGYVGNLFK